jgi:hypothetical protein
MKERFERSVSRIVVLGLALAAAGCVPSGDGDRTGGVSFRPVTRADSIAAHAVQAMGGLDAWNSARYLVFSFGVEHEGSMGPRIRHWWDRVEGRYRVEWSPSPDTTIVVLMNVDSRKGEAFANGSPMDDGTLVEQAYRRHINDTYWLLAPLKMLDSGVNRKFVPDSSDAETDVIRLTFQGVGLTPGDTYWMYVDRGTGMLVRWSYFLQGWGADRLPETYEWADYRSYPTPSGDVQLAARKTHVSGKRSIVTGDIAVPAALDDGVFSNPQPLQ